MNQEPEEEVSQVLKKKICFNTSRNVQSIGLSLFLNELDEAVLRVQRLAQSITNEYKTTPPPRERVYDALELFYQNTGGDTYREEEDWTRNDLVVDKMTMPLIELLRHAFQVEQVDNLIFYLKCIRNLSRTSSKMKMIHANVCDLVIATLLKYPAHPEVNEWCLRCTANLLISEDDAQRKSQTTMMINLQLHRLAVNSLRAHGMQYPKVGEIACYVLYLVVFEHNEIRRYFFEEGVPEIIKDCLVRNLAIANFSEAALRTICSLIGGFADGGGREEDEAEDAAMEARFRQAVFSSGVMKPVVRAMQLHCAEHEEIASLAICIMVNLIRGEGDIDAEAIERLIELNAEYEIVTCMRAWSKTNVEIAQQGCLCIFALVRSESEVTKQRMLHYHVDALMLRCMKQYMEDDRVVEIALATLSCLVGSVTHAPVSRGDVLVNSCDFVNIMKTAVLRHSYAELQLENDFSIGELIAFVSLHFCQSLPAAPLGRNTLWTKGVVHVFLLLLESWPRRSRLCVSCCLQAILDLLSVEDAHHALEITVARAVRKFALEISLHFGASLGEEDQRDRAEHERQDRVDIFTIAQEVLSLRGIASEIPVLNEFAEFRDCTKLAFPAHDAASSSVVFSPNANLGLLVERTRVGVMGNLPFQPTKGLDSRMRYCESLHGAVVACAFSSDLSRVVFVLDTREVCTCDLRELHPRFEFRLPSADANPRPLLPGDIHFVSFVRDHPRAVVVHHVDFLPNRPAVRRSALHAFFNGSEVALDVTVPRDEDTARARKFSVSADGCFMCRFQVAREDFTRVYKFEWNEAQETLRLVPFRHDVPKSAVDAKTNGSVLVLSQHHRFSKWQIAQRAYPVLLQMWVGFGYDNPRCFLGRTKLVVTMQQNRNLYAMQVPMRGEEDASSSHTCLRDAIGVDDARNVSPTCVVTQDERCIVLGVSSNRTYVWDLEMISRKKLLLLVNSNRKRLPTDLLQEVAMFLF